MSMLKLLTKTCAGAIHTHAMRLSAHGVNTALLTTKTNVSASEFTTLRRYTNLFIVIIIIISPSGAGNRHVCQVLDHYG